MVFFVLKKLRAGITIIQFGNEMTPSFRWAGGQKQLTILSLSLFL
jgi:hypothetical protein